MHIEHRLGRSIQVEVRGNARDLQISIKGIWELFTLPQIHEKCHDAKILKREFKVFDYVLLFNSRYELFPSNLNT